VYQLGNGNRSRTSTALVDLISMGLRDTLRQRGARDPNFSQLWGTSSNQAIGICQGTTIQGAVNLTIPEGEVMSPRVALIAE
jgi:hypothetical protein